MERHFPVLRAFGLLLFFFGLTMLAPLALSLATGDGAAFAYDDGIVGTCLCGLALWYPTRHHKDDLKLRDGFLMVVMIWTLLPAFATIPLMAWYWPQLSFTDAYFETVSGLTTTGATVLSDLDKLPMSINFWRGQLVWMGGMGLVVLAVAVFPMLGIGGRQMFKAETPGPMKDSKLTPRITQTAKGLWGVYLLISVACALSLWAAGMSGFDAVMHTFSTMGLGGFSSHDASYGYWNSPLIEGVTVVFMLIAGLNFATHFLAVTGRSFRPYRSDPEAPWFVIVTLGSVLVIALYLVELGTYPTFAEAFRHSLFNTVSIATTTGFASVDYNLWPIWAPLWMLFLSSFATSAGSTGGGIKMMRAILLYKQVYRELVRAIHPNAIVTVKVGGEVVAPQILFAVLAFAFAYMCLIVAMTLLLTFSGLDIVTSFSAVGASINTTGPGLNQVGPATTFAVLTDFQTWVCTIAMLLGRLEIFSILVVLTPAFWRR
jgi:trk system potassium uptake protein TrkH